MPRLSDDLVVIDDVALPPLVRMQWAGNEARDYWEPVLEDALTAGIYVALTRLKAGAERIKIIRTKPSRSFLLKQLVLRHGLYTSKHNAFTVPGVFSTEIPCKYLSTSSSECYIVAATQQDLFLAEELLNAGEIGRIAELTGTATVSIRQHNIKDDVMALLLSSFDSEKNAGNGSWLIDLMDANSVIAAKATVLNLLGLNVIWRCDRSLQDAATLEALHDDLNTVDEIEPAVAQSLAQLLALPIELTSYHGLIEVKTPVFKFIIGSDALQTKVIVRMHSEVSEKIPHGARGLRFPYKVR